MIPLSVVTPGEARDRSGPIVPTPSASNLDVLPDAWRLWRGLDVDGQPPSLLLSPEGSRDANGPVSPTIIGDVQVVEGRYGKAWNYSLADVGYVQVPVAGHADPRQGTFIIRFLWRGTAGQGIFYIIGANTASGTAMHGQVSTTPNLRQYWRQDGTIYQGQVFWPTRDAWDTFAHRWSGINAEGLLRRDSRDDWTAWIRAMPSPAFNTTNIRLGASGSPQFDGLIESAVFYPDWMPNDGVDWAISLPRRWEWGPDGTLAIPHPRRPGAILLRTDAGAVHLTLDETDRAESGTTTVNWVGGQLVIGTTRQTDLIGVVTYGQELPPSEIGRVLKIGQWSWDAILSRPAPAILRLQVPKRVAVARVQQMPRVAVSRRKL